MIADIMYHSQGQQVVSVFLHPLGQLHITWIFDGSAEVS